MSLSFVPKHIEQLAAYSSAKSEKITGDTWLNANESPFSKTIDLVIDNLNRYPDPQPENVILQYANYVGLNPKQILMTRGADEGIELLVRTYCESNVDSIAIFAPTYGMYKVSAESHNVALNVLSQDDLNASNSEQLSEQLEDAKLVFICNPNNPTGSLVSKKRISEICSLCRNNALVVVDEAYIEFCPDQSVAQLVNQFDNLVVLRTLSKAFAVAGLRVGFLLTQESNIAMLGKVLAPYPVSSIVATLTEQVLSNDNIASVKRQVSILNELKVELVNTLSACSKVAQILPSFANFVTIKLVNESDIEDALKHGLVMRQFNLFDQTGWVRISIGSKQELQQVTDWLNRISK